MKKRFQSHYNRDKFICPGEINILPSITIPDQSYTVEEIYRRFAQGRPLAIQRIPVYDGDVMLPDYQRLDLAEREQLLKDVQGRVKLLQKDYSTLKTQYEANKKKKLLPDEQPGKEQQTPPEQA